MIRLHRRSDSSPIRLNPSHIVSYEEESYKDVSGTAINHTTVVTTNNYRYFVAETPEQIDNLLCPTP